MKKTKILIGIFYTIIVFIFLYIFFSKFNFQDIGSYKFIQTNMSYLVGLKENNIIILSFIFLFLTVIWVFLLGFGSPVALLGGFIFSKWYGTFLVALSLSFGAMFLYIFANYFFKDYIKEKFLSKFYKLEIKFKKNEFIFFFIYRFIGGIPFCIANILPVLFNINLKNYFFGSFLGMMPQIFVMVSLGSGLESIIANNENSFPGFLNLISSPDIYFPILGFFIIFMVSFFLRKKFLK